MKIGDLIKVRCPQTRDGWYHGVIVFLKTSSDLYGFDKMWCAETSAFYAFNANKDKIDLLCKLNP